jgi:nucleoside-diphosphate-sugar epimerase
MSGGAPGKDPGGRLGQVRVVVAGGTGFVGTAVQEALAASGADVTAFARRGGGPGSPVLAGDLTDAGRTEELVVGADVVVHAAPYLGEDPDESERVNVGGTRNLVRAAAAAGALVIQVSTTAVYGPGPHRGIDVGESPVRPASTRSVHRHEAEQLVREGGGLVLRPGLVYGVGDTWVVPAMVALVRLAGGLPDGGRARVSVVAVEELGALVAGLCDAARRGEGASLRGRVLHAARPEPATVQELARETWRALELGSGLEEVPARALREAARARGFSDHQLAMALTDHWFRSDDVWKLAHVEPWPRFALTSAHAAWYRDVLARHRG